MIVEVENCNKIEYGYSRNLQIIFLISTYEKKTDTAAYDPCFC